MTRPLLYDVFCKAGGCTKGYQNAGFYVVGIDHEPQPRYCGDEFIQMDALEFLRRYLAGEYLEADVFHASPPCQSYSITSNMPWVRKRPKMIEQVRGYFRQTGKPYVIENVPGAPLENPVMLCGLMFGLKTIRHRRFEVYPFMLGPYHPPHPRDITTHSFREYSSFENGATHITLAGHNFRRKDGIIAMGDCEWMTREELAEAIPPAFTEFIGRQLLTVLERTP